MNATGQKGRPMQIHHGEPIGASARVLIAAFETGAVASFHHAGGGAAAIGAAPLRADADTAEVPALVVDDEAYTGASRICEYLDEATAGPRLLPDDAFGRWQVRVWQKLVDDGFGASVRELALGDTPADRAAAARERIAAVIAKAAEALDGRDWLVGDTFTLADIAIYAYAACLPRIASDLIAAEHAPALGAWMDRVSARNSVRQAMALASIDDPFGLPPEAPPLIRWG